MVKAGFDDYCMWTGGEGGNEKTSNKRYWDPYIHTKEGSRTYVGKFGPDIYSDFIVDFISKKDNRPFFAYYPMTLTHTPFVHTPHAPDVKTNYQKHQAMVEYTDIIVGKIMDAIENQNLSQNTYIFFTTDNGTTRSIIGRRNASYIRGGKTFLSENGINAPFIVRTPKSPSNSESDALIDFTDVYPTILDLAGIRSNTEDIDGHSFAFILSNTNKNKERKWVAALGSHPARLDDNRMKNYHGFRDRIITNDRYKVYLDTMRRIHRLYDIRSDPHELRNLISDRNLRKTLKYFRRLASNMPTYDHQSRYVRSDTSYYDVPALNLNRKSSQAHTKNQNMSEKATEKEFLRQKSKD